MSSLRVALVWLCCALLVGAGAPVRATAPCHLSEMGQAAGASAPDALDAPARSCCAPGQCHCNDMSATSGTACECGTKLPARTPSLPAPKPVPVVAPLDSETQPRPAADEPDDAPAYGAAPNRSFRALPARLRQEALSVWRL